MLIQRQIVLETDYPTAAALSVLLTAAVVLINLVALAIRPRGTRFATIEAAA